MSKIYADIINIGDELLIGQVINTNASWIACELNQNGVAINEIKVIADTEDAILKSISESKSSIIIMTGGLGPTNDDITKKSLANYFNSNIIFHKPTYDQIVSLFGDRNYKITKPNKEQANIPHNCTPLLNKHGTAPGMWFDKDDKVIVSMPGVPYEMKSLIIDEVIPRIIDKFNLNHIIHRTVMTIGVGESKIAELIHEWEMHLPRNIKLAYLPQPGIVRLRLSTINENYNESIIEMNNQVELLHKIIPDIIFGYDDITMEEVVGNMLKESSSTISTAESCTGGYIAHLITRISGSSDYYKGSVISYSNNIKINQLNVSKNTIDRYGVVSREVIEQMATGGRNLLKTDYCIATSGIAGPKGGTKDKPVGTVWIAIATPNQIISKECHLGKHRERNIRRSALIAMNMLRQELSVE